MKRLDVYLYASTKHKFLKTSHITQMPNAKHRVINSVSKNVIKIGIKSFVSAAELKIVKIFLFSNDMNSRPV